jgi:hypothetical protein
LLGVPPSRSDLALLNHLPGFYPLDSIHRHKQPGHDSSNARLAWTPTILRHTTRLIGIATASHPDLGPLRFSLAQMR